MRLEHLPIPHLYWQEHHDQSREPDTTGTKPENAGACIGKQLRSGVGCNDTGQTTQARKHATDTATVASVEELGRRGIEDSVKVLLKY